MTVHLAADIQPGWRLYSMDQPSGGPIATAISLPPAQPFVFAGAIGAAKPHAIFDPTSGIQGRLYTGHAEFALPIKTALTAPVGSQTVSVEIRYQTCNDVLCLPPRTVRVNLPVQVRGK